MATVTLGNSYRFKDYNNNKYLNILVSGNPSNNSNVTIYSLDSSDMAQVWQCVQYSALGVSGALMKSAKDPTFALDNYRGASNPNNADVYKIGTTAADLKDQLVEFLPISNGYYRIKLVYADLYLTVSATTAYGGYNVNWQAITGNADQLWAAELYSVSSSATPEPTPTAIKDKEFFVKAYGTNLNLNVYGTDTVANARNVNAYEKEDCLAQRWIAKQTSAGPKLFTKINQSYALNINTADNNCTMYTAAGNDNDSVLEFEEAGDMLYRIKMFKYGKYLTVNGSTSGSNVIWSDYVTTATLWEFIPEDVMFPSAPKAPDAPEGIVGNTYAVQANGTDFYLNVYGTDTVADGRNVNIYNKDDCLAQRWFIKNTDNGPKLFTKVNEEVGYTLNIYTTDDNCTMYTDSTENDADSILEFISVGNMLYRIKMYHHDKYLCIDGAATSGANVKWISGASSATVWKLVPEATAFPTPASAPATIVGKTFFIKNYNTGYNLNVHGTNTVALGRNVNVFAKEPEDSQRWQVVQTPKGPKIITEINPDFALNIHVENNNNCVMYDIDDNNADSVIEFVPYDEDKNIYKLKMFHHNKYLEAAGVGSGFNAYWSDSPVYNLWQFVEEDDMFPPVEDAPADIADKVFFIQNVNTGYYLNVHGADTVANTRNVNVYAKEDVQAQRWIIRNGTGGPKLYTRIDETFAVNIYANDNNCTMYKEEGNDVDSVLEFIPYTDEQTEASENIYRIKMHYHNRYLTVANRNIGSNAYWTAVDTEPYALWKLIPESEMSFEITTPTEADSPLVTLFIPAASSNYMVGRNGRQISEITIHHMAGNMTVQRLGAMWQDPSEVASSHYGVHGKQVGQYVKECDTAYTNGGSVIDPNAESSNFRAITIETANTGTTDSNWPVSNDTLDTLVDLVADIARRNNLGTLVPGQNLTWHSMYAYTECPGNYLRSKMQEIADRANEINSSAVFIRKLGTQYPLVITSTASDEGYGVTFSKVISESNQKWIIKDTAEGKEIINAFDTTQNLRLNSTNDAFVVSSNTSLSKAYLVPDEGNSNQFTIKAITNGLSRTTSYVYLAMAGGVLIATAYLRFAEKYDKSPNADAPSYSVTSFTPSYLVNRKFNLKNGDKYITYRSNAFTLESKSSQLNQIFVASEFSDGPTIAYFDDTSKYLSMDSYSNDISTVLPTLDDHNVSLNIRFEEYRTDQYFIHSLRYDKFLFVDTEANKLCWGDIKDLGTRVCLWIFEEPAKEINSWLKVRYNPQNRIAEHDIYPPEYAFRYPINSDNLHISEMNDNTGTINTKDSNGNDEIMDITYREANDEERLTDSNPDDYIYITSFTKKNSDGKTVKYYTNDKTKWAIKEARSKFNYYASSSIGIYGRNDDETGPYLATKPGYEGYYWVAVGPRVLYPEYSPEGVPGGEDEFPFYGKGTIDVILIDNITGEKYYLPCVVGDIKAHTWNNGVLQTWFTYWDYTDNNKNNPEAQYDLAVRPFSNLGGDSYNDDKQENRIYNKACCVEFIGDNLDLTLTENYSVEKLIFYREA